MIWPPAMVRDEPSSSCPNYFQATTFQYQLFTMSSSPQGQVDQETVNGKYPAGDDQHERRSGTTFEKGKGSPRVHNGQYHPHIFPWSSTQVQHYHPLRTVDAILLGLEAHVVLEAVFLPLVSYLSCSSPSTSPLTSLPTSTATAMPTTTTITTTTMTTITTI